MYTIVYDATLSVKVPASSEEEALECAECVVCDLEDRTNALHTAPDSRFTHKLTTGVVYSIILPDGKEGTVLSIYATLWEIALKVTVDDPERPGWAKDMWVPITAQGVPGHITEPYDWLPPAIDNEDKLRAVVFIHDQDGKDIQRYTDPLLVLSGDLYDNTSIENLIYMLIVETERRIEAGQDIGQFPTND